MYNPSDVKAGEHPDFYNELTVYGNGRVVKVRFADQPIPNVTWVWIATGNCHVCKHFEMPRGKKGPRCLNPDIPDEEFLSKYLFDNTCPGYEAGMRDAGRVDILDVMRAIGMVEGEPSQAVEVIRNLPWSITASLEAHRQQSIFLNMARLQDSGKNKPSDYIGGNGEIVDMADDLEGPTPVWESLRPGGALEGIND